MARITSWPRCGAKAPARPSFREAWNENWRARTPRLKWPESKLDSRLSNSAIEESGRYRLPPFRPETQLIRALCGICARVWCSAIRDRLQLLTFSVASRFRLTHYAAFRRVILDTLA